MNHKSKPKKVRSVSPEIKIHKTFENNLKNVYYMSKLEYYFKKGFKDDYFSKIFKDHITQSWQSVNFMKNIKSINDQQSPKKVYLEKKSNRKFLIIFVKNVLNLNNK